MTGLRSSSAYKTWRKEVLAKCEPVCIRCGYPVDMTLPGSHPDGPSADHEPPLAETGEIAPSLDAAGIAHLSCNKSHGGRLGSARASANRAKNVRQVRSSDRPKSTPAAPRPYPPEGQERPQKGLERTETAKLHQDGFVLPRLETPRHGDYAGSYGPGARDWLEQVFDLRLRGWQAYALDRALEHNAEGDLIWSTVVLTVSRQSGKSVLSRGLCMWRLHHADLFGEPQTILHVANKRATAMEVMRPAGLWAVNKYGKKAARWGNESAGIELPSGDRWLIHAANESAGVGFSISMAFCDESAFIPTAVVESAIAPTMAERNNPQLYLVSTAGDSKSDLLLSYRQRAIDKLDADDPGNVLLLEWSAPPTAEIDDLEAWKYASPEWSEKREKFLRQQFANVDESAWRREYLNQCVIRANHWLRDSWWNETKSDAELPAEACWSIAVESDFDGMGHAVAIAAPLEDGSVVVRVSTHRTIREVDTRLGEIRKDHPNVFIQVTPGYVERLQERFDALVGQREAAAATQNILDLFDRRAIKHDGSEMLLEHFAQSTISKRQGGWVMSARMGHGGVYAARAVMFAAAQASKAPRPVARIHTRRRA